MAPNGKRFLVAVDKSEGAKQAFKYALSMAGPDDTVIAIHVQDDRNELKWAHDSALPLEALLVVQYELETRTDTLMKSYEKLAKDQGVPFSKRIVKGDPRTELCLAAEREAVDLVVVGSRGHGLVKRMMMGSVSDWVVYHCCCPVLVVRHQTKEVQKRTALAQAEQKAVQGCCGPVAKPAEMAAAVC